MTFPLEILKTFITIPDVNPAVYFNNGSIPEIAYELFDAIKGGNYTDLGSKVADVLQHVNMTSVLQTGKDMAATVPLEEYTPMLFTAGSFVAGGLLVYSYMRFKQPKPVVVAQEIRSADAPSATPELQNEATLKVTIDPNLLFEAFKDHSPLLRIKAIKGQHEEVKADILRANPWFDKDGNIKLVDKNGELHAVMLVVDKSKPVHSIPVKDILSMPAIVAKANVKAALETLLDPTKSHSLAANSK